MPVGQPSDLVQRGRIYYFRRAVPCGLRDRVSDLSQEVMEEALKNKTDARSLAA